MSSGSPIARTASLPDGKTRVPLHTARLPFPFQWCCKAVGLSTGRLQGVLIEELAVAQDRVKAKHRQTFEGMPLAVKEMNQ
jgi:hypothetical protein